MGTFYKAFPNAIAGVIHTSFNNSASRLLISVFVK